MDATGQCEKRGALLYSFFFFLFEIAEKEREKSQLLKETIAE